MTYHHRTKPRLAVIILSLMIGVVVPPTVALAGTQGSCNASDTTKVRLWENQIGDTGDGNDSLWKCGSDSSLTNDNHDPAGTCKGFIGGSENWNDCVSSVTIWVPNNWCAFFYRDAAYGNEIVQSRVEGPAGGVRINLADNDVLTSFLLAEC